MLAHEHSRYHWSRDPQLVADWHALLLPVTAQTIALLLVGIAAVYVGVVAWFSNALDSALKRRAIPQQVDLVPRKVVESYNFQALTNGTGEVKTNAP